MNIKKSILSCLLMMGFLSASAQGQEPKTEYIFNPHWYVQGQVGGQYTLGEVGFGDLLSPNVQLGIGYQFSSVVGLRLSANAWQSKGGSEVGNKDYTWKWSYVAPSLDLTFNLSNLVAGFNPNRVFNLSLFGGVGANFASGNDDAQEVAQQTGGLRYLWDGSKTNIVGRLGANFDFKVSDAVTLGIELNANALSDKYNSKKAENADWYFNALAGIKINLGKTYTTRTIPAPEPEIRYVEKIVEKIVEKPVEPVVETVEPLRRDVFFKINSSVISPAEGEKVQEIADYLTKYPNAKVSVTGYADAGTGNDRINDRLAAQRADAVVKQLKEKFNISADRISYDSKGSRVQPFAENDQNRVSICIAE